MREPQNEDSTEPETRKEVTVKRPLAFNKKAVRPSEDLSPAEMKETIDRLAETRRHEELCRKNTAALVAAIKDYAPVAEVVELLKQDDIDLYLRDNDGNGLLHLAVIDNNLNALAALINAGTDLHMKNLNGVTPLMMAAACYGGGDAAVMLTGADPDLSAHVLDGVHPIHFAACTYGKTRLLEKLLERGVSPTLEDPEGHTPLYHALHSKRGENVEIICMAGGFREKDMPELEKAIAHKELYGTEWDYEELLRCTGKLDREALEASFPKSGPTMPPVPDELAETVFKTVRNHGSSFRMEKFGGNREALDKRNHDGQTPLMELLDGNGDVWAARNANWYSNQHARDNAGRTHLHYAVQKVSAGPMVDAHMMSNLNAQDMLGRTPLMLTVDGCDYMESLMKNGADLNIKDRLGLTALDIAKIHKVDLAVDYLQKEKARRAKKRSSEWGPR